MSDAAQLGSVEDLAEPGLGLAVTLAAVLAEVGVVEIAVMGRTLACLRLRSISLSSSPRSSHTPRHWGQ